MKVKWIFVLSVILAMVVMLGIAGCSQAAPVAAAVNNAVEEATIDQSVETLEMSETPVQNRQANPNLDLPIYSGNDEGNPQAGGARGKGTGGGGRGSAGNGARGAGQGNFGVSQEPLSQAEIDGLIQAVQEELRAQALYEYIMDQLGEVSPFVSIAQSEEQHAAALIQQADKYGIVVPDISQDYDFPEIIDLTQACQIGVEAEIADAALYDELLPVTTHENLIRVYTNLKNASLNNHLPAFEACK